MRVRVLYFGTLRDLLRKDQELVDLPEAATVATLLDRYREAATGHAAVWDTLAVAVNAEYASAVDSLRDGDEVALLPPVSGGLHDVEADNEELVSRLSGPHVELVRGPIDGAALSEALKRGEDGAVVVFDGFVRNNTRGRRTLHLFYESYEDMALSQMRKLGDEAVERFGVRGVTIVHRLGRLEISETSVLIAVASAHRGQAFEACRWLIDTLKKTVPIWKREHFEDGAVWADGEPFPEGLAAGASVAETVP